MPDIQTNEFGDPIVNDYGDPVLVAEPVEGGESESTSREFAKNLGATVEQAGVGLTQGFASLGAGANKVLELRQRLSPSNLITGNTTLAEQFKGAAETAREQAKLLEQTGQETEGPAFTRKLAAGAVSIVPAIAAGPLGVTAAIGASALTSFADTFQSAEEVAIKEGATPEEARRKAALPAAASGLATAAITALGGKIAPGVEGFAQSIATKGFKDAAKKVLLNAGAEATEEGVDQLAQAAISVVSYNPQMTLEQAFGEALEAAQIGGLLGAGLTGVSIASQPVSPAVELAKSSFLPATAEVLKGTPPPLPSAEESFAPRVIQPDANAPLVDDPFLAENPVGKKVGFYWPEGGSSSGTVVEHTKSGRLKLEVQGQEDPVFISERQIVKTPIEPAVVQESLTTEVNEFGDPIVEPSAEPSLTPEQEAQIEELQNKPPALMTPEEYRVAFWDTTLDRPSRKSQDLAIRDAIRNKKPISFEAANSMPTLFSEKEMKADGYVREGDRYIYSPTKEPNEKAQGQEEGVLKKPRKIRVREPIGDILDDIEGLGGLVSKSEAKKTGNWEQRKPEYDDVPTLSNPVHNFIYGNGKGGKGALLADKMAQALGMLSPKYAGMSVPEMWARISNASQMRKKIRKRSGQETRMANAEAKQSVDFGKAIAKGPVAVDTDELVVGSVLDVEGHQVRVIGIDPENGDVILEDGPKFGRRVMPSGEIMYVESMITPEPKGSTEFIPQERPSGELFSAKETPFNLTSETFTRPQEETTSYGGDALSQQEMFAISDMVASKDPFKSADAAEKMYGAKAAEIVERQLRVLDSDPQTKKSFSKEQRARLKEVVTLLKQRQSTDQSNQRLGITNPIAAEVARQLTGTAQKWFTAEGNLPVAVFQGNVQRVGKIKEQLTEARYAERDLYSALRTEFKIEGTERLTDDFSKVPKPVVRQMNAVLKGEADPNTLPESLREPIARMRAHVDALSAIMLERGLIDEELAQIVGDNLGTYLTRSYRVFDDPEWNDKVPIEVRNRARHFILQGLRSKTPAATEREADTVMRSLMEDWRSKGVDKALNQGRLGNKDLTLFMKRKDIAPEIRALMGEYETPVINYMKSVSRIARLIADQEFLNQVKQLGMGNFLFEDGTQPRGFDTLIAAEGSATMSPLNGLRTTREIAEAFKEFGRVSSPDGVLQMLLALNAVAKGAKTIGSVMTQARNLTGQPFFWAMSGHWDWTPTRGAVKAVGADIGTNNQRAWRERYKEYVRLGIVDDSTQAQELRDAFKDGGLLQEVSTADEFAAKTMRNNLRKLVLNAPARAYQISDELGKIVGFENEVVRQQAIHPDWTEAQIKQEAATRIRNTYPTYSMVPEAVKKWRRQPIFGPFVSFAYETFRTTYWNLRYMQEDLASSNAAQKKAGAQRMAGIATVMASGYALSILSRALLGIDKKEEDDLRQFLPPWAKNSELLFTGKDDKGNLSYLNLSYLNPYSYLTDPFIAAVTNLRNEEGVAKATLESAKEFMSPFINEQIATAAMVDVMRNQTSTGREVYNPQDPEKWKDMAAHLFASVEPGTSQRFRKRIYPSLTGQQTEFGRVLNPTVEVAREVTGLNTETTDFRQAIAFKASEFRKAETLSEDIFRRLATKRGTVEPTELSEAYRKSEQVRFELYQDFFDDIQAARRRGVSDKEIYNAINARGISKEESRRLLRGVYQPYDVSPQIKARLKDIGRKLPLEDIRAIQKEYRNKVYQVN